MQHFGLIGNSLQHSFSKKYFSEKFEKQKLLASYSNFELPNLDSLSALIIEKHLSGFNVTIPYKEQMLERMDVLTVEAKAIGAVNCVKIVNGTMLGYNTDYIGFEKSFLSFIGTEKKIKALVCGTGGSSKAVQYCLTRNQIPFQVVSRIKSKNTCTYSEMNQEIIETHKVIINTTPLGMYPHIKELLPLPYHFITPQHYAYDLIYNPEISSFLQKCLNQGAAIKNGMEMLYIQAEESHKIFLS